MRPCLEAFWLVCLAMIAVFILGLSGCATSIEPMHSRPYIKDYIIDLADEKMLGPEPEDDFSIRECIPPARRDGVGGRHVCYAFTAGDYQLLLEYIAKIERRLHACEVKRK